LALPFPVQQAPGPLLLWSIFEIGLSALPVISFVDVHFPVDPIILDLRPVDRIGAFDEMPQLENLEHVFNVNS
jgi:hypothetical protein